MPVDAHGLRIVRVAGLARELQGVAGLQLRQQPRAVGIGVAGDGAALDDGLRAAPIGLLRAVRQHLRQLRARTPIEQAQRAPGASDLEMAEMKKEKLRLKEEIARLNA